MYQLSAFRAQAIVGDVDSRYMADSMTNMCVCIEIKTISKVDVVVPFTSKESRSIRRLNQSPDLQTVAVSVEQPIRSNGNGTRLWSTNARC